MEYVATFLNDDGERVAASRRFTLAEAEAYCATVCKTREPEPRLVCTFCGVEWRTGYNHPGLGPHNDWPRCINCDAC